MRGWGGGCFKNNRKFVIIVWSAHHHGRQLQQQCLWVTAHAGKYLPSKFLQKPQKTFRCNTQIQCALHFLGLSLYSLQNLPVNHHVLKFSLISSSSSDGCLYKQELLTANLAYILWCHFAKNAHKYKLKKWDFTSFILLPVYISRSIMGLWNLRAWLSSK